MLEYFPKVEETGAELIVTDHNEPVLRIVTKDEAIHTFAEVRAVW